MYCKNCGKEISTETFCPNCGVKTSDDSNVIIINQSLVDYSKICSHIRSFGCSKLVNIFSLLFLCIGLIVRYLENKILSVRIGFGYEDYFISSDKGKSIILVIVAAQIIATFWLSRISKADGKKLTRGAVSFSLIAILIHLLCAFIRFPAPW